MFDLPAGLDLRGANALDVGRQLARLGRAFPWVDLHRVEHAGELQSVAERIDLFRFEPPAEIAQLTRFAWCQQPDGGYRLSLLDGEWVSIREDHLGRWEIHAQWQPTAPLPQLPRVVRSLRKAVLAVDSMVARSRPEAVRVVAVDARWRRQSPSDKQLQVLRRRRIPHPPGLTRGQASWMIELSKSR
jgi:hypothetical protein